MRGGTLKGLAGAATEAATSLSIELSPDGHVLMLIKSDDFPEPAVFGFPPAEANALGKRLREAARDAEAMRRVG